MYPQSETSKRIEKIGKWLDQIYQFAEFVFKTFSWSAVISVIEFSRRKNPDSKVLSFTTWILFLLMLTAVISKIAKFMYDRLKKDKISTPIFLSGIALTIIVIPVLADYIAKMFSFLIDNFASR